MKEPVLVIIKPDGMRKHLVPNVLEKIYASKLEMIALKLLRPEKALVEAHYAHLNDQPFFNELVGYFMGKFHRTTYLMAFVFYGQGAIRMMRKIAGATNPEKAAPQTIRGAYGRITTQGVFENVVHVSSDRKEAVREIQLWFSPQELTRQMACLKTRRGALKPIKEWA